MHRSAVPRDQVEQQERVEFRKGNAQLAGHERAVRHRASDAQRDDYRVDVRVVHHHGVADAGPLGQRREHTLPGGGSVVALPAGNRRHGLVEAIIRHDSHEGKP